MTVEEVLAELGDDPIHTHPSARVLLAILNRHLPEKHQVDEDISGAEAITKLYQVMNSDEKIETVLSRHVGRGRRPVAYRNVLVGFSAVVVCLAIMMAVAIVISEGDPAESNNLMVQMVAGSFRFIVTAVGEL